MRSYQWIGCGESALSTILISVVFIESFSTGCYPAGDVIVSPDNLRSIAGSTVTLTCESISEVDWSFYPDSNNSSMVTVFASGRMNELFVNRYHVRIEKRTNGRSYITLVINPAVTTDSGRFVCSKSGNQANGKSSRLIVYGE